MLLSCVLSESDDNNSLFTVVALLFDLDKHDPFCSFYFLTLMASLAIAFFVLNVSHETGMLLPPLPLLGYLVTTSELYAPLGCY